MMLSLPLSTIGADAVRQHEMKWPHSEFVLSAAQRNYLCTTMEKTDPTNDH